MDPIVDPIVVQFFSFALLCNTKCVCLEYYSAVRRSESAKILTLNKLHIKRTACPHSKSFSDSQIKCRLPT